jgi:hypothetical protein
MRHYQRWHLQVLDYISNRKSFSRAGCPEQDLVPHPLLDTIDQLSDRFGLVPGGTVWSIEPKVHLSDS